MGSLGRWNGICDGSQDCGSGPPDSKGGSTAPLSPMDHDSFATMSGDPDFGPMLEQRYHDVLDGAGREECRSVPPLTAKPKTPGGLKP